MRKLSFCEIVQILVMQESFDKCFMSTFSKGDLFACDYSNVLLPGPYLWRLEYIKKARQLFLGMIV